MFIRIKTIIASIFILLLVDAHAFEEKLKAQDVAKVMQKIFAQHLDQKDISVNLMRNAFKVYIDQFDLQRTYLLESEVSPFLNLSQERIAVIMNQYRVGSFDAFEELNRVIQKSILRSRAFREKMEHVPQGLFEGKLPARDDIEDWRDPDLKRPFAKTDIELQERTKKEMIEFIDAEKKRFGDSIVLSHQPQTLSLYEKNVRERENHYLFLDADGRQLPPDERENLFVLHILKALASSLDAHTTFYSDSEAFDVKMLLQKAFQGVGVVLEQTPDNSVYISDLAPGGPAFKSGKLKIGDRLLRVDGQKIAGLPFEKITAMMRGAKGSEVTLEIKRKSSPEEGSQEKTITVTLKREEITLDEDRVESSVVKINDGIIGIITLRSFYQGANGVTSEQDMRKALEKLKSEGHLRGLILDLRENSGGFLNQAVKVAGLFITNGVVVISKYFNGEEHFYRDLDNKVYFDGPLIVLTSRATASAAEIVAQALQDYGVALIVGDEQTYGKGTIQNQTVTDEKSTSYFKVTVGRYYTVSGKTPQIDGVKADIVVPGVFNFEHIGERYLSSTVPADTIPEDYEDDLSDVSRGSKEWFLRYYLPTLQHKKLMWRNMLPTLKANSAQRIAHDSAYQNFLQILQGHKGGGFGEGGQRDFQLIEATNIMKDMISNP